MDQAGIPKLNLQAIPLVPGFKSHRDVPLLQSYYGKRSIAFSDRVEKQGPKPDIVYHNHGPYSARPLVKVPSPNNQLQGSDLVARAPTSPNVVRSARPSASQRAKWIRYDRETLRFFMYFQEAVPESPYETYRIRKVTLLYYRSDDSIQLLEPRVENSGMNQGGFLHRTPVSELAGVGEREHLELTDLIIGSEVPLFGRVMKIVDVDEKTRRFFNDELGMRQPSPEPYPEDPQTVRKLKREALVSKQKLISAEDKPKDNLREFLKYGQKSLMFNALWDDSNSLFGEKRYFKIHFFLADESIQVNEIYKQNSGREPFPKFLSRRKITKQSGEPYSTSDFICGTLIEIGGRDFLLLSCDTYTKAFYERQGVEQIKISIVEEKKELPRMEEPPYNGFGSEEDSLGSFYNLVPKPPRKDYERLNKYSDTVLHFRVELVSESPEDKDRRFDLSFHLGDESIALFEAKQRNSGITGGKFLERGRYKNAVTGKRFCTEDMRSALKAAVDKAKGLEIQPGSDTIEILKRQFRFYNAEDPTFHFFDIEKPSKSVKSDDPVDTVFVYIVSQLLNRRLNIREMFKKADKDNSRSIQRDEFLTMLSEAGIEISEADISLVMARFTRGGKEIWYQDFCDALSTHWTPPVRDSTSRIEQIQTLLLNKFRHSNTQLRVLFRNFDKDKNGMLTFSEFKRLLKHYMIDVSDEELAGLMALYDKEQEGAINYNEFCDVVYECDFSSVLDMAKQVTGTEAVQTIQVGEYLAKIQNEERSLEEQLALSEVLLSFVDRIGQRSQEMGPVFRAISKSGNGKVTPDEFFRAVQPFAKVEEQHKPLLQKHFFPEGEELLQHERFMEIVSKSMVRKGKNLIGLTAGDYA